MVRPSRATIGLQVRGIPNLVLDVHTRDTNNHVENLMGIVGQKVKTNHQSWVDANLNIMLNTIWHIIS